MSNENASAYLELRWGTPTSLVPTADGTGTASFSRYQFANPNGYYANNGDVTIDTSQVLLGGTAPSIVWVGLMTARTQYVSGGTLAGFDLLDSMTMPNNGGTARVYGSFLASEEALTDINISGDNPGDVWAVSVILFWPANADVFPLDVRWWRDTDTVAEPPDEDALFGINGWTTVTGGIAPGVGQINVINVGSPGSRTLAVTF